MAFVTMNMDKLRQNYHQLDRLFKKNKIQWTVVSKILCGNRKYLEALLSLGMKQVCDSRVSNLKIIKSINPDVETFFIKPAAKQFAQNVVKYADVSFNSSLETVRILSSHAVALRKVHKIIIMVELGERREGVMKENFYEFYKTAKGLPNIEIMGIGANLTCMSGVLPDRQKLEQLCELQKNIKEKHGEEIPLVSGGASVTIPLIHENDLPEDVNHFRVGETLFLGTDCYNNEPVESLHQDVFTLSAQIIELDKKPNAPSGKLGLNLSGEKSEDTVSQKPTSRAIVDIGLLDVEAKNLEPVDRTITIKGESSDMMAIDLKENRKNYKVGDLIEFRLNYLGVLRIMHSRYVEKRIHSLSQFFRTEHPKELVLN